MSLNKATQEEWNEANISSLDDTWMDSIRGNTASQPSDMLLIDKLNQVKAYIDFLISKVKAKEYSDEI